MGEHGVRNAGVVGSNPMPSTNLNPPPKISRVSVHKLTAEEYSKLPEITGFKDELIEGDRVFSPIANFVHGVVLDNLQTESNSRTGMSFERSAGDFNRWKDSTTSPART